MAQIGSTGPTAAAQQTPAAPGSPSAPATIDGKYLPLPPKDSAKGNLHFGAVKPAMSSLNPTRVHRIPKSRKNRNFSSLRIRHATENLE